VRVSTKTSCSLFKLPPTPRSTLFPYTTLFRSGTQNFQSTWRRLRSPSRFERSGVLNIHRRTTPTESLWKVSVERSEKLIRRGCRSEEHTSELQSRFDIVCRLLLEKKKKDS